MLNFTMCHKCHDWRHAHRNYLSAAGAAHVVAFGGLGWGCPRIVASVRKLRVRSARIDGEAVVRGADGVSDFDKLHSRAFESEVVVLALYSDRDGEAQRGGPA